MNCLRSAALLLLLLASTACSAASVDGRATVTADGRSDTVTDAAEPRTSTGPAEAAPEVSVNGAGVEHLINVESVRKWARDAEKGDVATLTSKCWTMPAGYIRDKYVGPGSARLASILAQKPDPAQAGIVWGPMNGPSISVTWAEGKSDYACPKVDLTGSDPISDDYVAYRVQRYILRIQGRPVRRGDVQQNYPLECSLQRGDLEAARRADPNNVSVASDGRFRWRATAGTVSFTVSYEPSEPCIQSAR